ncbi:hypothetical protein RS130_00245 [Paraglaciecola aquimarina]|uniref:Lipoprotein n=1 Tax=Paraglaciecola aquimarina TaxID=1235557 RepID=A0ABU3SRB7_9ALTE|nr:hypothetical protein [Paraglaciecola aquimarina]MDU0352542.1 hypothetical protein [Paraglaciecola aquimarina]
MSKYTIVALIIICVMHSSCSLAPAAANRSQKAYDSGDYKESLRLANRALTTYEYSAAGEANLWILIVDNYIQLEQYAKAYGTLRYIIEAYSYTETSYRAKSLLQSLDKISKQKPQIRSPKNSTVADFSAQSLNINKTIASHLLIGKWDLTTSNLMNGNGALAPRIDKYEFKANGEVLLVDTLNQFNMIGSYKVIDESTVTYSFTNPRNRQKKIDTTLKFYLTEHSGINKLQLISYQHVFTYIPASILKNDAIIGTWKGVTLDRSGNSTPYELVLSKNGLSDGFNNGKRTHYGYYRYWFNPLLGNTLHLSMQMPSYGNYGISSYSVNVENGVMLISPIANEPNQKIVTIKLTKVDDNDSAEKLWLNKGL